MTRSGILLALLALSASAQWVEDSIDVGGAWVGGMVYNSKADVVYGNCQYTDGIFFAIDCSTNQLVANWRIPWPREAAYDSLDNKCYVAFCDGDEDSVMVIEGETHTRLRAIALDWANIPVWDPVGNRLYVSCDEMNRVSVIDCATDSVIAHIPTPAGPLRMHLNTRHRKLYVQCHDAESLAIVDLRTNLIRRRIGLPNVPEAGCYSEVADRYYCGTYETVTVIDGVGDTVVATVRLTTWFTPYAMASVESRGLVAVGAHRINEDSLFTISTATNRVVASVPTGRGIQYVAWNPTSDLVYTSNQADWSVMVIRGDGSEVVTTLPVNNDPYVLLPVPRHRRIYLSHLGSSMVYVIRDTASAIVERPVRPEPRVARLSAYPNPSRSGVLVATEEAGPVRVHSADGRLVRVLAPRQGVTSWDGTDPNGRVLPNGVYCLVSAQGDRAVVVLSR